MSAAFSALVLLPYFVPAAPVAYSAVTDTPQVGSVNILGDGARVFKTIALPSAMKASSPNITFLAGSIQWLDSPVVSAEVTDASSARVFKTAAPASSLHEGLHEFSAKGLVLRDGEKYAVTITSKLTKGGNAVVEISLAVDQFLTTENGVTVNGDPLMPTNGRTK